MKFKSIIGIDVSKSTLDAYLKINHCHAVFDNNEQGYQELVEVGDGKLRISTC
jgi:hypothetical protein